MSINKDQVKGRVEEAKGSIKEASGKVVGDATLEAKGNIEKNLGKVQAKVGDIRQDLKHSGRQDRPIVRGEQEDQRMGRSPLSHMGSYADCRQKASGENSSSQNSCRRHG